MRRGTTPTLTFTLPEEIDIAEIYVTFSQNGKTVLEKNKDEVIMEKKKKTIIINLSQEDTLNFDDKAAMKIQLRIRDASGNAMASDFIQVRVYGILKDGVI